MQLKTVQWNIGGAFIRAKDADPIAEGSYATESLEYVCATLKELQPDIITLEEVHTSDSRVQAKLIADSLGFSYFINNPCSPSHLKSGVQLGQAIISRFPILQSSFELFVNPNYKKMRPNGQEWTTHDKGVTSCVIKLSEGMSVTIQATHLIPFGAFDIDPLGVEVANVRKDIIEKLNNSSSPFLMQGDFNYPDESLKPFLPEIFSTGTEEIITKKPTTPWGKRYDHIVFRGMKLIDSQIIDSALTDHYPIVATFEI